MSRKKRPTCPSTCSRKVAHATRAEAELHRDALKAVNGFRRARVYRCPVCKKFFVSEEAIPPHKKRGGK